MQLSIGAKVGDGGQNGANRGSTGGPKGGSHESANGANGATPPATAPPPALPEPELTKAALAAVRDALAASGRLSLEASDRCRHGVGQVSVNPSSTPE